MRYYASIESYKDSGAGQNGLFGSDYSVVAQGRSVRGVKEAFVNSVIHAYVNPICEN